MWALIPQLGSHVLCCHIPVLLGLGRADACKVLYEEGAAFFNTYLLLTRYFILKGLRHQLFIIYHCSSQHCQVS